MKKNRRHKKIRAVTQCDSCEVKGCRMMEQCAKAEFMALAAGEVYHCPEREPGYWERLEAA